MVVVDVAQSPRDTSPRNMRLANAAAIAELSETSLIDLVSLSPGLRGPAVRRWHGDARFSGRCRSEVRDAALKREDFGQRFSFLTAWYAQPRVPHTLRILFVFPL